jgi:RNA polymerase sigma factor (sigma-70 family)
MSIELRSMDDSALMNHYRTSQDTRCIGVLFQRYRHLVFGVCLKYLKNAHDSEDATMEIFGKLHLDLQKSEVTYFKSWLHTVARNHCLMSLRKAGLAVDYPEMMPNAADTEGFDEDDFIREKLLTKLEDSMHTLKEEQRQCVELFYIKDKSYKDIVQATGLSLNEVKTHIQNGKLNLKKILMRNS